jgi:ADP-ribose pyrophosphatase YjhB (NUDIX family)
MTTTVKVGGEIYSIGVPPRDTSVCFVCKAGDLPLLGVHSISVCEPCTKVLGWAWGQYSGEITGSNLPWTSTAPAMVSVFLVRENHTTPSHPFDLLTLPRPDEPGAWSAPGGRLSAGESPEQAAIRLLSDATGLVTWAGALEPLYLGHNLRGRLVQVFLCRGFYGTANPKAQPEWKTWPPEVSFNFEPGFHRGAGLALLTRAKLQRGSGSRIPLTLQLRRPAYECFALRMQMQARAKIQLHRELTEAEQEAMASDLEMVRCYKVSMNPAETELLTMVAGPEGGHLPPGAAPYGRVAAQPPPGARRLLHREEAEEIEDVEVEESPSFETEDEDEDSNGVPK